MEAKLAGTKLPICAMTTMSATCRWHQMPIAWPYVLFGFHVEHAGLPCGSLCGIAEVPTHLWCHFTQAPAADMCFCLRSRHHSSPDPSRDPSRVISSNRASCSTQWQLLSVSHRTCLGR